MDPAPIFGDKILEGEGGSRNRLSCKHAGGHPARHSIMGVLFPNAWMGSLKNIDLVKVFGSAPEFWKGFAAGVAAIQVQEGNLQIVLKEQPMANCQRSEI